MHPITSSSADPDVAFRSTQAVMVMTNQSCDTYVTRHHSLKPVTHILTNSRTCEFYIATRNSENSHVVPELTTVHDAVPCTAPATVLSHDQNIHQSHVIDGQAVLQKMTKIRTLLSPLLTGMTLHSTTIFLIYL